MMHIMEETIFFLLKNMSFFNYRFLLCNWISRDKEAVKGITDFDIVFKVSCGDDFSSVDAFYSFEMKHSTKIDSYRFLGTLSIHKGLKRYSILWIIDGYDEPTSQFEFLLKDILKDLSEKHKILITAIPSTFHQLLGVKGIRKKKICELMLKKFGKNQINQVIKKYEIELNSFDEYYKQLEGEDKMFLETPLNLNLVLQLWPPTDNVLMKDLNTTKLYECLFETQIKEIVERLKDTTDLENSELKWSVEKWFDKEFCKCAAEALIDSYFLLKDYSQSCFAELTNHSRNSLFLENYYLSSSFLDLKKSFEESNCYYRHVLQKEAFASIYLDRCDDNEMGYICDFASLDKLLKVLYHCNDCRQFLNLFSYVFEHRSQTIFCVSLLTIIENEKKEIFDSLKNVFIKSENKLSIRGILNLQHLKDIIALLLPEVTPINCYLEINEIPFDHWSDAVNEYRDKVNFILEYSFNIRGNREIQDMIEKVSEPFSDSRFQPKCFAALLNINGDRGDSEYLLKSLVDIAKYFHTLTIEFCFYNYSGPDVVLDSKLIAQFATEVKVRQINLHYFKKFQLQLLNASKVERLKLNPKFGDDEMFSEFLKKINWKTQTNITGVFVYASPKYLKCLYETIPETIACNTWVNFDFESLSLNEVPQPTGKKFREIRASHYNYETYKMLKRIAIKVVRDINRD